MPQLSSTISESRTKIRTSLQSNRTQDFLTSVIFIPVWFGIVAGLIEAVGILLFQRINYQRWGPTIHVSKEILWISPVADVLVFGSLALVLAIVAGIMRRSAARFIVPVLVFLTFYDWLALTERLYYRACVLLALGVAFAFHRWWKRRPKQRLQFCRKSVGWLLTVWLLVFIAINGSERLRENRELAALPPSVPGSPNVLVIVIDTLRADHVSAYGYRRSTTPNLDRIARQGVLFENAISACSWTLPSHASLLTARSPSDHGMQSAQPMPWLGWGRTSLRGYPTIGEALQRRGYRTGAFSANQTYFTSNVGLGRGFIRFEDYFQSPKDMFMRTFVGRDRLIGTTRYVLGFRVGLDTYKPSSEVNRELLAWIGDVRRPFFAFLNYIEVHNSGSLEWTHSVPEWGVNTPVDKYDSALTYVDSEIGKLMVELRARGLANTLVVVTADHGESLGQHHLVSHGSALFLEQIHVPLMLWWPDHIPAGVRVTKPVSNVALAPTLLDLVNAKPGELPGSSLSVFWRRGSQQFDWPSPISELAKNQIEAEDDKKAHSLIPTALDGDMKSVLTSRWHLIEHQTMGKQLYYWVDDPGELKNVINTPEGQAVAASLEKDIERETLSVSVSAKTR